MLKKTFKTTLFILLFVTFIDFMGLALIYPIFSKILFDTSLSFLPSNTSNEIRGIWLGFLFALMPLVQFFSLPIWGAISDGKGRRKPLLLSLSFTILGGLFSISGIFLTHLSLLALGRVLLGVGAGNISIVQASIADISSNKNKAKNFSLYGMAIGLGFTVGPFLGGILFTHFATLPFIFSCSLAIINLVLAIFFYKETVHQFFTKKVNFYTGIKNIKKVFKLLNVRVIFLCAFLTCFAWSYTIDFIPVYLIKKYNFSSNQIGLFYGAIGAMYALSSGSLIRPFLSRFSSELLFFIGALVSGVCILSIPFYPTVSWLAFFVIFYSFFTAFLYPSFTTLISNGVDEKIQGETLGTLGSVTTAAYAISALIAGVFIGMPPSSAMWTGGSFMLIAAVILLIVFRKKILKFK